MKKINENQKITLTIGQLKRLVNEGGDQTPEDDYRLLEVVKNSEEVRKAADSFINWAIEDFVTWQRFIDRKPWASENAKEHLDAFWNTLREETDKAKKEIDYKEAKPDPFEDFVRGIRR